MIRRVLVALSVFALGACRGRTGGGGDAGGGSPQLGNYPLVLTTPRANLPAGHRITRAYPGIEYNVRVVAIGGAYPYRYALANAPDGMTVDEVSGVLTWPSPIPGTYPSVTAIVTDSAAVPATVEEAFTLRVETNGFQFIDALNGHDAASNGCSAQCGDGTREHPWRTLNDMYENGTPNAVTYLRGGGAVYTLAGIPLSGACQLTGPPMPEDRVEFNQAVRSVIWLGYPGESRPVIDFGHDGTFDACPAAPRIRLAGSTIYVDQLELQHPHIMAFQIVADATYQGATVRRSVFRSGGVGIDGSNSAYIMTTRTSSTFKYGAYFGENDFAGQDQMDAIKTYEEQFLVIADNVVHDNVTFGTDGELAIKGAHERYELRGNRFFGLLGAAIGGNTDGAAMGEVRFNQVVVGGSHPISGEPATAYHLNQSGTAGPTYVYRNTFVGEVRLMQVGALNGPFELRRNVFINDDTDSTPWPHVTAQNVADASRVTVEDNLVGTPATGMVDGEGKLQGSFRDTQLGAYGFEL